MEFTWDDEVIQVSVPIHYVKTLIDSYQQMFRSLEPFFSKEQLQSAFRDFLNDLEGILGAKLEAYQGYTGVAALRIKEQLTYLVDSLKKLFAKMDLSVENFEIKIKQIIFSKCQFN